jgi:hypothetical protein
MAVPQLTRRHALLAAPLLATFATAAGAGTAHPLEHEHASQNPLRAREEKAFIERAASLHPDGKAVAISALRAGFLPEECTASQVCLEAGRAPNFTLLFMRESRLKGPECWAVRLGDPSYAGERAVEVLRFVAGSN